MTDTAREFDVVLFGATGAAGRVTARHLAAAAPPHLRIALAGRSLTRLQSLTRDPRRGRRRLAGGRPRRHRRGRGARPGPPHAGRRHDRGALRQVRRRPRGRLRGGGHRLLRHHRGGALRAPRDRRPPRDRPAHRSPDRAGLWVRLRAERPGRAPHRRGGSGRRSPARPHPTGGAQLSAEPGGGTVDTLPHPGRRGDQRQGRAPRHARPLGPCRGGSATADEGAGRGRASGTASRPSGVRGLLAGLVKASPVKRDADNGHFTGPFVMAAFNTRIVARSASLLGYGAGLPLRRVHRLRRRPRGCRDGRASLGRPPGGPGRHGLPPDPRAPRPGAPQARGGAGRGDPGQGPLPVRDHR